MLQGISFTFLHVEFDVILVCFLKVTLIYVNKKFQLPYEHVYSTFNPLISAGKCTVILFPFNRIIMHSHNQIYSLFRLTFAYQIGAYLGKFLL